MRSWTSALVRAISAMAAAAGVTRMTSQPCSAMKRAVPEPFQLAPSSRTMTRRPRRALFCMTSSADQTLPRSMPGSAGNCGRARWKPVPAGCEPGARITSSAPKAAMSASSNRVLSSTLTWSLVSCRSYQSRKSRIWPRRGCMPARRNWPPRRGEASTSVT